MKQPIIDTSFEDQSAEGANKEIRSFRQKNRLALKRNRFASVPSISTRSIFSSDESSRDKLENKNTITSHINTLQLKVKPKRETATVKSKTPEKIKIKKNIVRSENRRLRTRVAFENNSTIAATTIGPSVGDSEGQKASKKKIVRDSKRRQQNGETIQKTSTIKAFFFKHRMIIL